MLAVTAPPAPPTDQHKGGTPRVGHRLCG